MLQIEWKQKHKSEYGTWDKSILTPPSIKICPLFDEVKKGDIFTPLPPVCSNVTFWAIFFFLKASVKLFFVVFGATTALVMGFPYFRERGEENYLLLAISAVILL